MASPEVLSNNSLASGTILVAESTFFIGKFKLWLDQVEPHPNQRALSEDWVGELYARFQETGIDRALHPIKVLLKEPPAASVLEASGRGAGVADLPTDLPCLVYQGQHRVAACKRLDRPEEHWWFAEVYSPDLEKSHPAEFLTLMHSSNEEEYRFPISDADRFMAMYRLLELHDKGLVDKSTYVVNQARLERNIPKDCTRQGLKNLLRSKELAESIAQVLSLPHLRPCFNAATWGKKLVKGRFYTVRTSKFICLIREMIEQCRLLQGSSEVHHLKAYKLPASGCTWKSLQSGVKKKSHPWAELDGGAEQALERVKVRPPTFVHLMNPKGKDDWMLDNTVSLPSVLTSDSVLGFMSQMYQLGQHLIHMIAGRERLERYISNQAHENEDDHPHGIIFLVLQERLKGRESSNYPIKIIHHLWKTRDTLHAELSARGMSDPLSITKLAYQDLIDTSQPWWELLSLFKLRKLHHGLDLVVSKHFASSENIPGPGPAASEDSQMPPLSHQSVEKSPGGSTNHREEGRQVASALAHNVARETLIGSGSRDQTTEDQSSTPPPRKR
ncbi:hypothetical protein FS749_004919, partial [Ceratobasidium sp. UAMH 11750]